MAGVNLEGIMKRFGNNDVVKDLTIDIEDREFLVLVGPSGCGKTTTLRMIAGLEDPSSGIIRIGDRVVNDLSPKERDIAMVFQNYALYPHMNVYENMAFGLKLRHVPRVEIDRRVRQAAQILDIEHLLRRKPRELSGGQRQRVALGRAIVREPAVFLMDEPLSNLDAKLRVQMRAEISKLHRRLKTTIIYVTHDQTEAMTMGSRIAVMKDGLMQQLDTPQAIYDKPSNRFVAGFIGSPAMNFVDVKVDLKGNDAIILGSETWQAELPSGERPALRSFAGKKVTLGIRPEHLYPLEPGVGPDTKTPGREISFAGTVEVRETLGAETLLHVAVGAQTMIVRADPRVSSRVGETVQLAFRRENVHLFDPDSERAIS